MNGEVTVARSGSRGDGMSELCRRIEAGDPEAIETGQRMIAAVAEAVSDWLESARPALRRLAEIVDQPEVRAYLAAKDLRRDLGAEHLRQNHAVYSGAVRSDDSIGRPENIGILTGGEQDDDDDWWEFRGRW